MDEFGVENNEVYDANNRKFRILKEMTRNKTSDKRQRWKFKNRDKRYSRRDKLL